MLNPRGVREQDIQDDPHYCLCPQHSTVDFWSEPMLSNLEVKSPLRKRLRMLG